EAAGVSARSINRWEQGTVVPQPAARRRLAEELGLDPADLSPTRPLTLSLDPPTAPLAWHVPLRRNPFFTGRDSLLRELHASLLSTGMAPACRR
ncbi:MAG: helix-turn-helix transcriptional regulator, partial [Chloroflexi bacterium]|nr:helix-turn-helix transcriptional regulator [Chloroflexota bacterium]